MSKLKLLMKRTLAGALVGAFIGAWVGGVLYVTDMNRTPAPAAKAYQYLIHGPIEFEGAERFRAFISDKKKGDVINIHIESWGGYVISMHKYVHYVRNTEAKTVCAVDSHAASAAAVILSHCDVINVADNVQVMFHVAQICVKVGPTGCAERAPANAKDNPEAYEESIRTLFDVQQKFSFTIMEWTAIFKGQDVAILGKDLMKRIKEEK